MSITGIKLQLAGLDGNAFSILGRAMSALLENDFLELADKYYAEATSGDYDHLLATTANYFDAY